MQGTAGGTGRLTGKSCLHTLLASCFLLPLVLAPRAIAAPSTQILSVSPPVIDLPSFYAPGATVDLPPIKVTNLSDGAVRIHLQAQNFVAGGEKGEPRLVQKGDPAYIPSLALAGFIRFTDGDFTLAPKQSREVRIQIVVPQTEPGGHYGVVQFVNTDGRGDAQVSVRNSVGSLVLFRVAGAIQESGRVAGFQTFVDKTDREGLTVRRSVTLVDPMDRRPVIFQTRFKNTGNVHYKPRGSVAVSQLLGGTDKLDLPQENVLPGSIRAAETQWGRLPLIGIVRAKASFQFGNRNLQTAGSETVWLIIFPWRIVVAILLITLTLAALLTYLALRFFIRPRLAQQPNPSPRPRRNSTHQKAPQRKK